MKFNVIASGSKGNATLVSYKDTLILIDMGVSLSCLTEGLTAMNKKMEDIDISIFTHDHSDHIKGVQYLKNATLAALQGTLSCPCMNLEIGKTIKVKDIDITPVRTSHDATNPCGFILTNDHEKLVYITDTGFIPDETIEAIQNPTYMILESNHDIKMLMKSKRTMQLKLRILSDVGHLCNEDAAIYACNVIGNNTKSIILAHLSEECNSPDVALDAWKKIFAYYKKDFNKYDIRCAKQYEMTFGGQDED